MKAKELKKINISISGEENNKTEIVYNNVIQNMGLNSEDQLKYLKSKINDLELEMHNRTVSIVLLLISFLGIGFGIFLMIRDIYLLGSLFIIITFLGVMIRFYLMYKNVLNSKKNAEYEKIENLRKLLNSRIR